MKISVIVPVYNVESYLKDCLNSLIRQTYKDWEAICIDDGSTDGSAKILDSFTNDKRFRILHKKNGGVWAARNDALELVSGDWVTFLDSDDWLNEEWFENAVRLMKNGRPDLIRLNCSKFKQERAGRWSGVKASEWAWRTLSEYGYLWLCFIRRSIIGETRFRPIINCKEDGVFLMELIPNLEEIAQGDYSGYNYRSIDCSLTKRNRHVDQSVAYLNAYRDIWNQQKTWVRQAGIEDLVRRRLRQGADHDVWEWSHMRDPGIGDPRDIRNAYLMLEESGALAPGWCYGRARHRLPFWFWHATGSFALFNALEIVERIFRYVKGSLR